MTDEKLLREYLDAGSEEAFAELVRRHADWIYSAALRMVRDRHLAEDVTQAVFMVLAKDGRKVRNKPVNAWLFGVMRYSAIHALRSRERQQRRERQAAEMAMQNTDSRQGETWEELAGRLEDSVWRLSRQDREAVLLRFYQQKSLAEVGQALGVSEDAARKRVGRAVGQLRKMLGTVEILGSAELAEMLLKQTSHAAPVGVKNLCVPSHSMATSGAGMIAKGAMSMMLVTKLKIVAAGLIALALIPSAVELVMVTRRSPAPHAAATTQPAISQMALAMRIKAFSNLHEIGQRLLLYSNENAGAYPPTLGDLVRTMGPMDRNEHNWVSIFFLPGNDPRSLSSMSREKRAEWVSAHSDYAYFGAGKTSSAYVSTILMAQRNTLPGDTAINLLFAYGSVIGFPPELAKQLLAQNSQPMIAAAKTAPTPQELADRRYCAGNLRYIWQIILLYRYTHAGEYPPNLDALQIGRGGNPTYAFTALQPLGNNIEEWCPSVVDRYRADFRKLEPEPAPLPAWIFNQDDYIYVANQPQPGASDATRIIAYDKDKNHGDGVNILFGDGHVRWYPLVQAHEIIQKSGLSHQ